jgi:uncharacterized protein involved in tellurium resistance
MYCEGKCTKECIIEEKPTFIKADTIDGEWLSPVPSERKWQEEKLVEIFAHYPNASPKWQYMNGLIQIALEYIKLTKEDDNI